MLGLLLHSMETTLLACSPNILQSIQLEYFPKCNGYLVISAAGYRPQKFPELS